MDQALIPVYLAQVMAGASGPKILQELPYSLSTDAGIFYTDICSFTSVTQKLASRGHYGVEDIIDILNRYFTAMGECLEQEGGHLIKYGGDAMFMIFPGPAQEVLPRIKRCSEEMLDALKRLNLDIEAKYGLQITFCGAVSYGEISLHVVGDPDYHLDYYVDGSVVRDLYLGGESAGKCEILWGEETLEYKDLPYSPPPEGHSISHDLSQRFISAAVSKKLKESGWGAELRNSAAIFIHLGADSGEELIPVEDFQQCYIKIQEHVYALDGTINKIDFSDKGYLILITFGIPYGHTDDIERAFTCAYRLKMSCPAQLTMRQGITYSNVFAGILGSPKRHEYGIIGNMVNIAARLMQNSKNGEISFSEEILEHVSSRFDSVFEEETYVKGIAEPIRIYKLKGELPDCWYGMHQKYQNRHLVTHKRFVRDLEKSISAGDSCFVELSGESGYGKSFLAYRILYSSGKKDPGKIHIAAMDEYNQQVQCAWFLKLLSAKLMISEISLELDKLGDFCAKRGVGCDLKLLRRFFPPVGQASVELSREESTLVHQMLAEIALELLADCRLVFIDDMGWMDQSSQKIFDLLLPRLVQRGACVVIADKEEYNLQAPIPPEIKHYKLRLKSFSARESRALLKKELVHLSDAAAKHLHRLGKGNPLFLVELIRIVKEQSQSEIIAEADLARMEKEGIISNTIENLLLHEYEHLGATAQRTLKIASIIGKAFALEDLSRVSEDDADNQISHIVNSLSKEQIIGRHNFDPGIEYVFNNQLMRDAIYRTILLGEKRALHERLGRLYEEKYADKGSAFTELIAYHYIVAQNREKGLYYAIAAATKTSRMAAYAVSNYYYEHALSFVPEDAQHYQIGLAMLKNYIHQGDPATGKAKAEELKALLPGFVDDDFHLQWLRLLILSGAYREVILYYDAVKAGLKDGAIKGSIILRYMDALQYLNRLQEYEYNAKRLEQILGDYPDVKLQGDYDSSRAVLHLNRSEYAQAKLYYDDLLRLSTESEDLIQQRIALNGLGIVASRTGDKEEARGFYKKALGICEKLGDRNGHSKLVMELGTLYRNEGRIEDAIKMYQTSLRSAQSIGNQELCGTILYNLGEAHYYLEKDQEAGSYFSRALAIYEDCGDLVGRSFCYDAIGDLNFSQNNLKEAESLYQKNLSLQKELGDKEGIAHTLGNLGNIAKSRGDFATAESLYLSQVPLLEEVGDVDGLGRSFFNHAMILKDQGEYHRAKARLQEALQLFEKCRAQLFIDIAKEQMQEILAALRD